MLCSDMFSVENEIKGLVSKVSQFGGWKGNSLHMGCDERFPFVVVVCVLCLLKCLYLFFFFVSFLVFVLFPSSYWDED